MSFNNKKMPDDCNSGINTAIRRLSQSSIIPEKDIMTKRALEANQETSVSQKQCQDPHTFLLRLLREKGYELDEKSISVLPGDFFLEVTEKRIADYDNEVILAIRQGDIEMLRELLHQGKSMQCCNKFGESVLHMACRRGFSDVVSFLLDEAKVSLRVKDDYGRTPFHDACW
jgi:ankyrin repeat protein